GGLPRPRRVVLPVGQGQGRDRVQVHRRCEEADRVGKRGEGVVMLRRALLAGALIGAVTGLVMVHRDSLRLTAVWPVILGFALWDTAGERGTHGIMAALAAGGGGAGGYGVVVIVGGGMPGTDRALGLVSGPAVGCMG